jgi:ribosomal-protein-alanine N-acetyltransferase
VTAGRGGPAVAPPVRAAGPDDVDAVAALERLVFAEEAWSRDQVVEELTGPGRRGFVVPGPGTPGAGTSVVGYALTWRAGDVVDLQRIAVTPARQRQGTARALLDAAVAAAVADGAERMLLEVAATNTAALRLYDAAGFSGISRRRRYYRDGSDALVLERPLRS